MITVRNQDWVKKEKNNLMSDLPLPLVVLSGLILGAYQDTWEKRGIDESIDVHRHPLGPLILDRI